MMGTYLLMQNILKWSDSVRKCSVNFRNVANVLECSGNFRNVLESLEIFSNVLECSGTGNTQCYILEVSVSESI